MDIAIPIPMWTPEDAFRAYRSLVEENEQAIPILLWASRKGIFPVGVVGPEGGNLSLAEMYERSVEQAIEEFGQPYWVVASAEAYSTPVGSLADTENYVHGDAQRMAEAGDPNVQEVVVIVAISTTEEWLCTVPFTRTPHRVRWGTPHTVDTAEGHMADVLKRLVR